VYLKKSGPILRAIGSASGTPHESPFHPPRLEVEAERTISNYSLAANYLFNFFLYAPQCIPTQHILFLEFLS